MNTITISPEEAALLHEALENYRADIDDTQDDEADAAEAQEAIRQATDLMAKLAALC